MSGRKIKQLPLSELLLAALELLSLATLVCCLVQGKWLMAVTCLLEMAALLLPLLAARWLKISFTPLMRGVLYVYAFCSIVVGTVWDVYSRVGWFDLLTHGAAGFVFAAVGYSLYQLFHPQAEAANPVFLALLGLCFSLALSLLWELYKYAAMYLFQRDMQPDTLLTQVVSDYFTPQHSSSELLHVSHSVLYGDFGSRTVPGFLDMGYIDTITDMLVETVGAVIFTVLALLKKGRYAQAFIPRRRSGTQQ